MRRDQPGRRSGAPPRARCRGRVPPLSLPRPPPGPLLDRSAISATHPGRSLYVRLHGPDCGPGAAGKWTDAATGEHGDLLDLIALNRDLDRLGDVLDEARSFLVPAATSSRPASPTDAGAGAVRPRPPAACFAPGRPITGTLGRSLSARPRHHRVASTGPPCATTRPSITAHHEDAPREIWPALAGRRHRPRRPHHRHPAHLARSAGIRARRRSPIRAGRSAICSATASASASPTDVLAAGEGIETMLALKSVLPDLPMIAGLSANHLAALDLAPRWRRLYVARDNDAAGLIAAERLHDRGARGRHRCPRPRAGPCRLQRRSAAVSAPAAMLAHLCRAARPGRCDAFLPRDPDRDLRGAGVTIAVARCRPGNGEVSVAVRGLVRPGKGRAGGLPERAICRRRRAAEVAALSRPQWRRTTIFRRRAAPGFAARNKIAARRHPPLRFGPATPRGVAAGPASPPPARDRP